ncbi:hypothetical protein NBRC3257_1055 [Gluconobacter thailandicus NBRC 3257]|uniref:Transposase n=1 Tax=Gluconobacter thailandicus NBRC 3257 TaxID=1381097 RepID=A0ABQ0IV36_GLUTH|nr:hypothetical protein NBRC3255_0156 [Gluconobacter thailandicus NBRC 3255]GAD26056.1 hypothetical protein NBRC3257_1055 [Gluconobacter thailandicus NBRC 3257]
MRVKSEKFHFVRLGRKRKKPPILKGNAPVFSVLKAKRRYVMDDRTDRSMSLLKGSFF